VQRKQKVYSGGTYNRLNKQFWTGSGVVQGKANIFQRCIDRNDGDCKKICNFIA